MICLASVNHLEPHNVSQTRNFAFRNDMSAMHHARLGTQMICRLPAAPLLSQSSGATAHQIQVRTSGSPERRAPLLGSRGAGARTWPSVAPPAVIPSRLSQ